MAALQVRPMKTTAALLAGHAHHHKESNEMINYVMHDGLKFHEGKRVFSRTEVAKHDRITDGWLIIEEKVYNVTSWIPYHPGGEVVLMQLLGKDATSNFKGIQHSYQAREQLAKLLIGYVLERKRYTANEPPSLPIEFGEEGGFH